LSLSQASFLFFARALGGAMNALKILLVTVSNGVATVTFIATGSIIWPQALVRIVAAACGGYSAAH
jgi:hypothetical protein